jgi:CHAD domain-containing protein
MRVCCRQLRSTVEQFAAALVLPEQVSAQRLARIGSDLGLTRDLDVMRHRLEQHWLPLLPEREQAPLRKLLKQLKRERKLAFAITTDTLKGRRYLKLLARLQLWLREPVFTPLGEEPMAAWCADFQQVVLARLFTLPGWWVERPHEPEGAMALHQLRRRIKRARYGLANLSTLAPGAFEPWLLQLKQMQTALGDLQDLRVLVLTLERLLEERPDAVLPVLCSLICEARDQAWLRWHEASAQLRTAAGREALLSLQSGAAAGWSGSRSLAISSTAPGLNPA